VAQRFKASSGGIKVPQVRTPIREQFVTPAARWLGLEPILPGCGRTLAGVRGGAHQASIGVGGRVG